MKTQAEEANNKEYVENMHTVSGLIDDYSKALILKMLKKLF